MLLPLYNSAERTTQLPMGDPLTPETLIGPLHAPGGVELYERTLAGVSQRGGEIMTKRHGRITPGPEGWEAGRGGNWVWPVIVRPTMDDPCWREETFAPILYVAEFDTLEEAIK